MFRTCLIILSTALTAPAFAENSGKGCPPGLAKKAVPCVPPGQAKKGEREWHEGDVVDRDDDHHVITYPDRYSLPPLLNGEEYIVVGNQILKVDAATYRIITLNRAVEVLLD